MNRRKALALTLTILSIIVCVPDEPARAQANITGAIRGYVADDSGNFLPGASVTLSGQSLPEPGRTAITDLEGAFSFDGLAVGVYSMKAMMIGYRPYEVVQIVVNPDETRTFNLVLAEGLTERVVVVAERTAVDTTNTSTHEVLDATYVNTLPLISRRYQQILTLFPGVSNAEGFTYAQYHINGSRITQNGFRLDGANINDFVTGTFGMNVNQNAIERFEMNTSGYQAEYGEQSGGIANIVTKSGTNTFEFLYSGFYRTDQWTADTPGAEDLWSRSDGDGTVANNHRARPETQQWQELALGGPIVKNRLWFFTSFQYWQEDVGSLFNDSVRKGDRYHGQFKLTWQATPSNTLVANIATDPSMFRDVITDARYAEGTNFDQTQGGYLFQLRDTHTLSPTTFLEAQLFVHHQYLTARPSEEGLGPYTYTFAPGSPTSITGTFPNNQDRSTYRYRASNSVTSQLGGHRVKAGFDYSWMDWEGINRMDDVTVNLDAYVAYYGPGSQLSYTYDYQTPEQSRRRDSEVAVYAQDTWIVNENWTFEAGLRLDRQSILSQTNLAPRAGVSFDPEGSGKSKIYGNWGRFYDNVFADFVEFQNTDGIITRQTLVVPPYTYNYNVVIDVTDYAVDGELESPYKDSWTFGYERQLPRDMRVGVSTTHWTGKNQLRSTYTEDLSLVPPTVNLDPAATSAVIFDTDGSSEYDDWKVMVRKAFSHRFELLGSYTRSRLLGDTGEDFGFENRGDQRSLEYTRIAYDRPNVVNLSAFGVLPWGIEVTGIYRYQSGRLYSPTVFDFAQGYFVIDPNFGGKNSRRMTPTESLDLSVSKRFDLGRSQLRLTGQVFNLTNELNAVRVEARSSSGTAFGQPVDTDYGRILQLGLEVRF
jgi:outer membrane receptor protein involved in Fe transport